MGYKTYTCPIAKSCGGCETLAVPYPLQLKRKQHEVEELFSELLERCDIYADVWRAQTEDGGDFDRPQEHAGSVEGGE